MTADMTYRGAEVKITDDEWGFVLWIKLTDDRSIMLTYPKPNDPHGLVWPSVALITGNCDCEFEKEQISHDEFEDWAKIAIGVMPPERERRWLCQICNDNQGRGPMLPDEVWDAIAPDPRGLMCVACMQARVAATASLPVKERKRLADCFEAYAKLAMRKFA
jgi:hypothetical protein